MSAGKDFAPLKSQSFDTVCMRKGVGLVLELQVSKGSRREELIPVHVTDLIGSDIVSPPPIPVLRAVDY